MAALFFIFLSHIIRLNNDYRGIEMEVLKDHKYYEIETKSIAVTEPTTFLIRLIVIQAEMGPLLYFDCFQRVNKAIQIH